MRTQLLIATLSFAAASADASIFSVTGLVEHIAPPRGVTYRHSYGQNPLDVTTWDEQQGVQVSNLQVDMLNNPGSYGNATGGTYSGQVDSHYVHYWRTGAGAGTGTITFSGNIVAVIFESSTLRLSDPLFRPVGTGYDIRSRGTRGDFSINGKVITLDLHGDPGYQDTDQLRVLTEPVPMPGTPALVGLGLGIAAIRRRRADRA